MSPPRHLYTIKATWPYYNWAFELLPYKDLCENHTNEECKPLRRRKINTINILKFIFASPQRIHNGYIAIQTTPSPDRFLSPVNLLAAQCAGIRVAASRAPR